MTAVAAETEPWSGSDMGWRDCLTTYGTLSGT